MALSELEAALREQFDTGNLCAVATLAIDGYGGELRGYLAAVLRDEERARDVFADTMVEMWRDLPGFRWEASFRTWVYTLARHRLAAHLDQRPRRTVALSAAPEAAMLEARARTATAPWCRTEVKDAVTRMRDSLPVDDQTILILRVDRGMSWRDIAAVLGAREPALRKRFERIKQQLRGLVAQIGASAFAARVAHPR